MRYIAMFVLCLMIAGCRSNQEALQQPRGEAQVEEIKSPLVGRYYQGDGLGFNLSLNLKANGKFDCRWTGCLGDYGSTSGTWLVDEERIKIRATKSDGMFEDRPLGNMTVVRDEGKVRLVRDEDAKQVKAERDMLSFLSFFRPFEEIEEERKKQ